MNCDIDGTSGCTQLCSRRRGLHAASCDREMTLCLTCMPVTHALVISGENQVEVEEKTRLINQVLELQHTLEGIHTICMFLCSQDSMMLYFHSLN